MNPADGAGRRVRAAAIAVAVALVGLCACTGGTSVHPAPQPAKAEADRQPLLTFEQIGAMDQKTFRDSLPQLHRAIEQGNPDARVELEVLKTLQGKLRQTDESAPDYWPTVLRFLEFGSYQMFPKAPRPDEPRKILSNILSVGIMRGIKEFDNAVLLDRGPLGNAEFTNCRIIFTQNPVPLQKVTFNVCAFEFPPTQAPSPYLKKLCRILLASGLDHVSIDAL
jgi:hypothetical protein